TQVRHIPGRKWTLQRASSIKCSLEAPRSCLPLSKGPPCIVSLRRREPSSTRRRRPTCSVIPKPCARDGGQLRRRTAADELMLSTATISHEAQLRSLTLKGESWELVSTKDPMPRTLASLR